MKKENYDVIYSLESNNWWYKSKRDLFYSILTKMWREFDTSLDIGCGVGSNLKVLRKFSKRVIGIDNSKKAISYCRGKGYNKLHEVDATRLKFKKNSFDLALCSDVLEHIDDKKAIDEIKRVLKPNGILIISVPAHKYLWGPTDNISNHLRRYEISEVGSLLKEDFKVIKLSYWNFLMYFPDLFFIKLMRTLKKSQKQKNALEFIPNFLNKVIYFLLSTENKLFVRFNIPQGVSVVAIAQKNE